MTREGYTRLEKSRSFWAEERDQGRKYSDQRLSGGGKGAAGANPTQSPRKEMDQSGRGREGGGWEEKGERKERERWIR